MITDCSPSPSTHKIVRHKQGKQTRLIYFAISVLLATPNPALALTAEEMHLCPEKIAPMTGYFGDICKELLTSDDFRNSCASIPSADRIKCDGTEAHDFDFHTETVKKCLKPIAQGFLNGIKSVIDAALWVVTPSRAEGKEIAQTPKPSGDPDAAINALSAISAKIAMTDDAEIYKVNAQASSWKDYLTKTVPTYLVELAKASKQLLIEQKQEVQCMSDEAQNRVVCEFIGEFLSSAVMFKAFLHAAHIKNGVQALVSKAGVKTLGKLKISEAKSLGH